MFSLSPEQRQPGLFLVLQVGREGGREGGREEGRGSITGEEEKEGG